MKPHNPVVRCVLLAACALAPSAATAAGTSLQVPVGVRGIAMGGAFSAIADDATATYWNPAGLPWVGRQEIAATHADLYGSGINDDYLSFVLPLSRSQAAAVDFYHSGFRDDELDFGESRIGLSYGHRFGSILSAGASAKWLNRHTDLDEVSVRSGSGLGLDLGVLLRPIESLRVAVMAQDVFDTKVEYSGGQGNAVAYPRTVRAGAAYDPIPGATIAVDVDDFLHLGAEYSPFGPLTLRAGLQDDLEGLDGRMLSYGAGLRWSTFRFDYALVDHATLGLTSHFGLSMGFNFNPSQIRIEKVTANHLYTSLYKSYATEGFGSVRVRNLENTPVNTRFRVHVPDLMQQPSEQEIVLRPGATQEVPLTAVLPDRVLARSGDRPVQVQVTATYQSLRLPRTERAEARIVAYGPGAIDWSQGVAQAAAFVTTRDPVVESVARDAVRTAAQAPGSTGVRNLDFAAAIFDAVEALGVAYVPDPTNPYATISGTSKAVDTIYYPRQTLARHAGDCDDTSVLLAALLGNVGVRTQFVDVPGHIFLLVATDLHTRNQRALGVDEGMYVVDGGEAWIPLETTALGKGFAEAWRVGAQSYADWNARGRAQRVDVGGAQARYEPGELPDAPAPAPLDAANLQSRVAADLSTIGAWRESWLSRRFADVPDSLAASSAARNEIAHVYFLAGRMREAAAELERARAADSGDAGVRNNLGVVLAAQGRLADAATHFATAGGIDGDDAGIWLNLGLVRYAAGDSAGAEEPMDRGIALAGGYERACALLGLAVDEEPASRQGTVRMTAAEARALLKAALRKVPRPPPGAPAAAPSAAKPRPWTSRVAGGRSADRAEIADLLYWKP